MVAASQSSPANVRFRLRAATAEAHRNVEAAMALSERCVDRASYRSLLADLWGFYRPLEARLAAAPMAGLGVDILQRAKTPWLHADLTAMGLCEHDIAELPRTLTLPSIHCAADAFGVLYVIEGASLGGQIILRQIKANLGLTESSGARFFASYGAEVGEYWRSFIAAMEAYGGAEERAQVMQRAALATFDGLLCWINERALQSQGAVHHVR